MSVAAVLPNEMQNANIESGVSSEDQTKTFREFFKTYNIIILPEFQMILLPSHFQVIQNEVD